ncbi:MAG: molybdopterin-dependent oxidoreductase [Actinobacteria bacterium]|nr:molybdopterin-dependent oxidoreductase [Actinomycetota bacterium]
MRRSVRLTNPALALSLAVCLCVCGLVMAGCGSAEPTETGLQTTAPITTPEAPSAADEEGTALEVIGPAGAKSYTLEQIKAMPAVEGYGGMKSSTGRITPPTLVKGVAVEELFAEVGGFPEDAAVGIQAKDGYEMTVSYTQIADGDFLTYDMVTGDENNVEGPLRLLIAYEMDGQPLDPKGWGALRLCVVGPQKDHVTDGHWWVKWVTKLQIKPIEPEWSLLLSGSLTENMDRPTFETGATMGCHGAEWTDANGDTWLGIPLYLLCGRVDDDNVHSGPAYNRDLANAGYKVELIGIDGTTATVDSRTMYYNKELIVAFKLNEAALPEEYLPLRLVGEGITDDQAIGKIGEIKLLLPQD